MGDLIGEFNSLFVGFSKNVQEQIVGRAIRQWIEDIGGEGEYEVVKALRLYAASSFTDREDDRMLDVGDHFTVLGSDFTVEWAPYKWQVRYEGDLKYIRLHQLLYSAKRIEGV